MLVMVNLNTKHEVPGTIEGSQNLKKMVTSVKTWYGQFVYQIWSALLYLSAVPKLKKTFIIMTQSKVIQK